MALSAQVTPAHVSFLARLKSVSETVGEDAFFEFLQVVAAEFAAQKARTPETGAPTTGN